jgi:hypothetical protein
MQWKDPELKVRCNAALGHSLGSWSWESNRTGLETEVIVKEKCKELIQ